MSLYHGDFEQIGHELAVLTDGFKDFTVIANIPYGHQSAQYQKHSVRDTQNLYRRLGRFLGLYSKQENNSKGKPAQLRDDRESKKLLLGDLEQATDAAAVSTEVAGRANERQRNNLEHVYILARSHHYGHELSF